MKNRWLFVICMIAITLVIALSALLVVRNVKSKEPVISTESPDSEPRVVVWDSQGFTSENVSARPEGEVVSGFPEVSEPVTEPVITSEETSSESGTTQPEEIDLKEYFADSVFVGDSIFVGYRNYLANHKGSPVSGASFLAASSYTSAHALEEDDNLHPIFQGKKQPVWKTISEIGAKRVFLMFGTNDLVVKDGIRASGDVFALIDKIHEENPDVEIVIISMVPVYEDVSKGALNNPTIDIYNYYLLAAAADHNADFIDLNTSLKNEKGNIKDEYCSDNYVHETDKAYQEVWDPILTAYAAGEKKTDEAEMNEQETAVQE